MLNWEVFEFPSGVGLVTNHSISTTTYSQPNGFRYFASHAALAWNSASLIVVPYESQLFQPIGGFTASGASAAFSGSTSKPQRAIHPPAIDSATNRPARV